MAATITQNLPSASARSARSTGRPTTPEPPDFKSGGGSFDAALKQSVEQKSKPRDDSETRTVRTTADAKPAQKPQRSRKRDASESDAAPVAGEQSDTESPPSATDKAQGELKTTETADAETVIAPAQPRAESEAGSGVATPVDASLAVSSTTIQASVSRESSATVEEASGVPATNQPAQSETVVAAGKAGTASASAGGNPGANPAGATTADTIDPAAEAVEGPQQQDTTLLAGTDDGESPIAPAAAKPKESAVASDRASDELPNADLQGRERAGGVQHASADQPAVRPVDASPANVQAVQSVTQTGAKQGAVAPAPAPAPPPPSPERFAEANHPQIVSTVRGQLLPHGGSIQIRLDPPELGALLVQVTLRDGVINASFQTENASATQALSHSLTQLKHSLESQGVSVDKLQVTQGARSEKSDQQSDSKNNQQQGQQGLDWERQNSEQRKEMLKRMWAKLGAGDPLDLVA